jgi:hypothetical protein
VGVQLTRGRERKRRGTIPEVNHTQVIAFANEHPYRSYGSLAIPSMVMSLINRKVEAMRDYERAAALGRERGEIAYIGLREITLVRVIDICSTLCGLESSELSPLRLEESMMRFKNA